MDEQKEVTKLKKAKGTKITEGIIGASASKIVMATKNLNDAVATALKLTETMEENTLKIVDQEDRLINLKADFDNQKAQMKIDLNLAYQTNRKEFAEKYLAENHLVAVEKDEFVSLQGDLEDMRKNFDTKVNQEIGKANGIANSKLENEKKLIEANYQTKEAQNLAKIQNLELQLAFVTKQASTWENQLNEERKASIERSKNQSATVNVQNDRK